MQDAHGLSLDERAYDWALTKRLIAAARPYWKDLGLAAILLLLITLAEQAKPLLVKGLIDDYVSGGDKSVFLPLAGLFLLSVLTVFILQSWQTLQTKRMGHALMLDLRLAAFGKIHSQPLRYFDKNPVGALMTRVVYDVETINQFFTAGVAAIFQDFFTLLVITVTLFSLDWRLALVALATLPFLGWGTFLFRRRARENFRAVRANTSRLNAFLTENVQGMATVQLFNRQPRNAAKFDALNAENLRILLKQIRINAFFLPLAEALAALAITLVFWYGGLRHLAGSLPLGTVVAVVMYVQRFFEPLRDLTEKYNILQSSMASSERLFGLLDRDEEVKDPVNAPALGPVRGDLSFDKVRFAYDERAWVLDGLSFEAKAGQRIAIVGPTGAGKTSLINVLFRFYPLQEGRVLLDGVDLATLKRQDFRRAFALVPQEPFLFSGSLLENLRLSDPSVPRERVIWACQQTQADAFIQKLPEGYDSALAEGGNNLSTGQKQLLSFARALVFDPKVLVLDEATASVDTATEADLQAALEALLKGRTSLTIAHRLSTVLNADKILVLKAGRLAEEGTHAQLMAQNGLYRGLVELQFKDEA